MVTSKKGKLPKKTTGTRLGAHVSIAGGLAKAYDRAKSIGCESMQIFTRNQTQWRARPLEAGEIAGFLQAEPADQIRPVLVHDSYLINLASPDAELRQKSCDSFLEEMNRAEALRISYLIFHPGSHTGSGETDGLQRIAEALNLLIEKTPDFHLRLLVESTAGQGSSLGYRFEHLAWIIERIEQKGRIGVCLDTCHIFAAGYEIRTPAGYRKTMDAFDAIVGISNLFAFHLNDCRKELGSRVDRHAHIGEGQIGLDGFRLLVNDPRLCHLPMILETPGEEEDFRRNLDLLRSLIR